MPNIYAFDGVLGPNTSPVSRHPAVFLYLRQPASPRACNAYLLLSSHSLRSLREVDISWGWDQSTFFLSQSLSRSFPNALFRLQTFTVARLSAHNKNNFSTDDLTHSFIHSNYVQ